LPAGPPINTSPLGAPKGKLLGNATAIIQSVDSNTSPHYCTVLINNTFPAVSGYVLPAGSGPFAAGGTSGFKYYYNNSKGIGGSIVTVDQDTKTVLAFTGKTSTTQPAPRYANLTDHLHVGNLNPTVGSVVGPVSTSGSGTGFGNFPYLKATGYALTPVRDSGNILTTEFTGLTETASGSQFPNTYYPSSGSVLTSPTAIVVPAGAALISTWGGYPAPGSTYGPTLSDGTNTYTLQIGQGTGYVLKNGEFFASIPTSIKPLIFHSMTFTAIYFGGTTWRLVLSVDGEQVLDVTDGASPLKTTVYQGFYVEPDGDLPVGFYFNEFDYYGTTENEVLLADPSPSTAPVVTTAGSVQYAANDGTTVYAYLEVLLNPTAAPQWASGLRLFWANHLSVPTPGSSPYIDCPPNVIELMYEMPTQASQDLYIGYCDLTGQVGALTMVGTTEASPTPGVGNLPNANAPNPVKQPSGFSYVENLGQTSFDALAWIYLDSLGEESTNLAAIEYVYRPLLTVEWLTCGVATPNTSGVYQALWDNMAPGQILQLGVRYVGGNGAKSNVYVVGETVANPQVVPIVIPAPGAPPVPTFSPNSTTIQAIGNGSVPGILDDIQVFTTVTNIPQDGSVERIAWAFRKSEDALLAVTGSSCTKKQVSSGTTGGLNFSTNPTVGNLVVVIVASDGYASSGRAFDSGWNIVLDLLDGANPIGVAWKIWTSEDSNATGVYSGDLSSVIAYEIEGFNPEFTVKATTLSQTSPAGTPPKVTLPTVIPQEVGELLICAIGAGGHLVTDGGFQLLPPTTDWVPSGYASTSAEGYDSLLATADYFSLSQTTSDAINGFINLDSGASAIEFTSVIIEVRSANPSATTGGTVYPWVYYDEQDIQGFPFPDTTQAVSNGYGQVAMGIFYDFALAYVTDGGVIGPLGRIATRYTSPNLLQIPGQYLISGVDFVPDVSPGIPAAHVPTTPAVDGAPPYATAQSAIVQTLQPNGMNAGYLLSVQLLNQPQNGSLARVVYYYRVTSATYGSGATAAQNPWSYFSSAPAVGAGKPLNQLPLVGNYQENLLDLSVGDSMTYDFGFACRDYQNNETEIVYFGTSEAIKPSGGYNNGSTNKVVDSGFKASKYAVLYTVGGWKNTPVSLSNPYWAFNGINPSAPLATASQTNSDDLGNYFGADLANGSERFYGISWPIAVTPGEVLTVSAYFDTRYCSGSAPRVCIVDSDGTPSGTYSTIYASASTPVGTNGSCNTTWTVPSDGSVTFVAVMLDSNGCTVGAPGYIYMAKPMLQDGDHFTAYVDGPATPPTGQPASQSIAVQPQGTTASSTTNATLPTITQSATAPVSGGSAPASDQQPQGSLRFTPTGVYTQSNAAAATPSWVSPAAGTGQLGTLSDIDDTTEATGYVLTVHASGGKPFSWTALPAAPTPYLADDADVSISSPMDGQLLEYSSAVSKWVNKTLPSFTAYFPLMTDDTLDELITDDTSETILVAVQIYGAII
jgi:hypothetical protein